MTLLHQLLTLWSTWAGPLSALSGGLAGWYGKIGQQRMVQRRDRLDAGQQALQLVTAMQAREQQLQSAVVRYSAELDQLRARRWALDDLMQELHAQAIAARMMVHELEQRLGLPQTQFDPLPAAPQQPGPGKDATAATA